MKKSIGFVILVLLQFSVFSQKAIYIDGQFEDWDDIEPVYVDNTGDGQANGIDIKRIWAHNDEFYVYLRFELTKEINLQEDNDLALYIDYDDNINTGFKINGIGAELRYFFGERFGVLQEGNNTEFVNFHPLGMLATPTVSSTEFEVSFFRNITVDGVHLSAGTSISLRLEDNSFNGDEAPNELNGIEYVLDNVNQYSIPETSLEKPGNTDFRFMTYNVENDQLFDPSRKATFERIFKAMNPDLIALQEVRSFNSQETKDLIDEFLPGHTWYHKKHGFDIVTISKYPILYSESVDGNAAFFLDVDGQEVLLINCHLPCCDNNTDRQVEVDIIMEYIRDLKNNKGSYNILEGTPIIIAGDMNFVGDAHQPYTFATGDILYNGSYGPDFAPDWDDSDLNEVNAFATNSIGNFTWLKTNSDFNPSKLDWVFYTDSKLAVENTYALYTRGLNPVVLSDNNLQSDDVIAASDHLPVIVDFSYATVGIDDFVDLDISVYPNPVANFLNIESQDHKIKNIKVLNLSGQVVLSKIAKQNSPYSIDVSDLPASAYFLMLETTEGRMIKSFLKVK